MFPLCDKQTSGAQGHTAPYAPEFYYAKLIKQMGTVLSKQSVALQSSDPLDK